MHATVIPASWIINLKQGDEVRVYSVGDLGNDSVWSIGRVLVLSRVFELVHIKWFDIQSHNMSSGACFLFDGNPAPSSPQYLRIGTKDYESELG